MVRLPPSMVQLPRNCANRIRGDPHLDRELPFFRLVRRGDRIKGKRNLMKLHDSFQYQPAIGMDRDKKYVDTLCLSKDRYRNLESTRHGASLTYTAEGGVDKSSRLLTKDQNPETTRNRALRRSASPHAPYVQLWFGVPPESRSAVHGPHRGCNTYTYCGLYKISQWTQRTDARTGFRYYTVHLQRKADTENARWHDREIVIG